MNSHVIVFVTQFFHNSLSHKIRFFSYFSIRQIFPRTVFHNTDNASEKKTTMAYFCAYMFEEF